MRAARQDVLDERGGLRSHGGGPPNQAGGTPLQMRPGRVGHVLRDCRKPADVMTAAMNPHPRTALKHFDRGGRETQVDALMHGAIRDGVVMVLDLDVVIGVLVLCENSTIELRGLAVVELEQAAEALPTCDR